jgi:hypothetical protein
VRLTDDGREHVDAAMAALLASEQQLVASLGEAKRDRLAAALRELLAEATTEL